MKIGYWAAINSSYGSAQALRGLKVGLEQEQTPLEQKQTPLHAQRGRGSMGAGEVIKGGKAVNFRVVAPFSFTF